MKKRMLILAAVLLTSLSVIRFLFRVSRGSVIGCTHIWECCSLVNWDFVVIQCSLFFIATFSVKFSLSLLTESPQLSVESRLCKY